MSDCTAEIRDQMAHDVREIGGGSDVVAKIANLRAARLTGLTVATIENLRWRKVKRVPADVYVAVCAAKARHDARIEALAHHDATIIAALHMDRSHLDQPGCDEGGDRR
ncbi:hypothetical protein ATO13_08616 [Stappia sp. 22II-S9-Z10]|nr:hypothetical protein ATO13_08616 [Stappia sp. 22II-S9-Z10]